MEVKRITTAPPSLPELVRCEPYNSRLTTDSCVSRWQLAQNIVESGKGLTGNCARRNGLHRLSLSECRECLVGAARKAAQRKKKRPRTKREEVAS